MKTLIDIAVPLVTLATTYFLTEVPLMLAAIALFRASSRAHRAWS